MGDISTEPSMEEILSSIKRIIAEEGDAATGTRARRAARPVAPRPDPIDAENILELSDLVAEDAPEAEAPAAQPPVAITPTPVPMPIGAPDVPPRPEAIVSERVVEATRGPLEALSRIVEMPAPAPAPAAAPAASQTIDGMVREMLAPMLSDWLDANLPQIVEAMVAKEISRITGR
jgi:hypothetical protein